MNLKKNISIFINAFLPIKKKTILFSSYYGMFNDNPKAVFEEFIKTHKDFKIFWVKNYKCKEKIPSFVNTVEMGSIEYYKYIFRAQIVVDNHLGTRMLDFPKGSIVKKIFAFVYSRRRKKQLNISTWHGTALKSIGVKYNRETACCSDIFVLGDKIIDNQIKRLFGVKRPTLICGAPRNDMFFDFNKTKQEVLKKKLKLPLDKNIILYAPTFREEKMNFGINVLKELDAEKVIKAFQERFGGEWCIVRRVHHILLGYVLQNNIKLNNYNVIDGNLGDDMTEYLYCTDFLITDYSSSLFDCIENNKKCFLFTPDIDYYKNIERGFVFDFDKLPLPKAITIDDFIKSVKVFDENKYNKEVRAFKKKYGFKGSGIASKKAVNLIDYFILNGKKKLLKNFQKID